MAFPGAPRKASIGHVAVRRRPTSTGEIHAALHHHGVRAGVVKLDTGLLLSMPSATQLLVERQGAAGATCESLRPWAMTANATTFER